MQLTQAVATDIPELALLLAELFAQEAEFSPHYQAQTTALTQIIANPSQGQILIARDEKNVAGENSRFWTYSEYP
jgi:hypothetical protein